MSAVSEHLIDAAIDAYVVWRESSSAVQDAYEHWAHGPRSEAATAFAQYKDALDGEERASFRYALFMGRLVS